MSEYPGLEAILEHIAAGTHTAADLALLRQVLTLSGDRNVVQVGKYNVHIEQGRDIHIGDRAYYGPDAEEIRQVIHQVLEESGIPCRAIGPTLSREELLAAVHQAGAELRTYRSDIAGVHIERAEVGQVVEWVLQADPKERLGMILDQPGGGKTVVMRDVLERLEAVGVPVLAIKADALSGVRTREDLADRRGLPAPVEECARCLTAEAPLVVLLDQLDALSLALSRDQAALDVMLSTLARLREVANVRIVASCRTFDLNNDPRLSQVKVDRQFSLQPLDDNQVRSVLQRIGVDPGGLLPAHRALLAVPLHLDVYARVILAYTESAAEERSPGTPPESFRSLQELYEALWRMRIEAIPPDTPPPPQRVAAVYRLVEAMQTHHQLAVPVGILDEHPEAANYLERVGLIRREGGNWLFCHQTLFDYCYARRFVAQGRSLSQEILGGPQGLFERSQMVQVLAYLRGVDQEAYRRELTALLFTDGLRVHLRLLLIGWFGSLPDPTIDELRIARRLMQDADDRARFLRAAGSNGAWFDLLNGDLLPALLRADDEKVVDVLINYLGTAIQRRCDAVLAHLRPHLGQSEVWDARIAFCLSRLEDWQSDQALDVLCDLLQRGRAAGWERFCLYHLAKSNPAAGCRALRAYLDRRFDDLLAEVSPDDATRFFGDQKLLGEYAIDEVMEGATRVCAEKVIKYLLPWFIRVVTALTEPRGRDKYYPSDPVFAWHWYGEHLSQGAKFAHHMAEALQHLAQNEPGCLRAIATALATVESLAVQRVLVQAYLSDPETYAHDIVDYLTGDSRRLNIGEFDNPHYDSCRLCGAAFCNADEQHRARLEQLILNLRPAWEQRARRRGLTQLHFFKSVPPELLSPRGHRRLQELERRFPGFKLWIPQGIEGRWVGPPIEESALEKMSDEAWLGAMRKYDDATAWDAPRKDPLKGGVVELSRAFAEQVKKDPERFYRLARQFGETISHSYKVAAISGLAETAVPAEWVFDLARQFAPRILGEARIGICQALIRKAEAGVADDLLDSISDWALHDPDPAEVRGDDPHTEGINSTRGVAVEAVCRCARVRKPPQIERAFQLLEKAADDPTAAVRACVIENLLPLLNEDDSRAYTSSGLLRIYRLPVDMEIRSHVGQTVPRFWQDSTTWQ